MGPSFTRDVIPRWTPLRKFANNHAGVCGGMYELIAASHAFPQRMVCTLIKDPIKLEYLEVLILKRSENTILVVTHKANL